MHEHDPMGGTPPEGVTPVTPNEAQSSPDVYMVTKVLGGISALTALAAQVESYVGWDNASDRTLQTAGVLVLGAAAGAAGGFFLKRHLK